MSNEETIALHGLRLDQHDEMLREMKSDLREVKEVVHRLDKKLAGIPDTGLQCPTHILRLDDFNKRLEHVETVSEENSKSITVTRGGGAVVLFILTALIIPLFVNSCNLAPAVNAKVEVRDSITQPIAGFSMDFDEVTKR